MPTYEYHCDACDHQFELFQSITAKPERKCPECGRPKLRRLIGPGAAIVFKGSGFYKTDSRKASDNGGDKKDGESAAAEPEKSAAKASDD